MDTDSAPQMANLFSYHYEAAFLESLTKQDYSKTKKFNNTSRSIDDLETLNNDGILVKERESIYPAKLILNVENQDDNQASFLDIEVGFSSRRKHSTKEKFTSSRLSTIQIYQEMYHMEQHMVYIHHK